MFRTTQDITVKHCEYVINVPKGTSVEHIGKTEQSYAVNDPKVLAQQNDFDRKHRYVWIPFEYVEEVK